MGYMAINENTAYTDPGDEWRRDWSLQSLITDKPAADADVGLVAPQAVPPKTGSIGNIGVDVTTKPTLPKVSGFCALGGFY